MINPHWLRSFNAVVETGGFTRAADKLGLTQAAISQHLRRLEDMFGSLLIRNSRQIELTPSGTALLKYCRELELADKRLRLRLSDDMPNSGEFSLISPGSIGLAIYPYLLQLQRENSDLTIRHRFAPNPETLDAILSKEYELGLVTLRPDNPRLVATPFVNEALELVVPKGVNVESWIDLEKLGFIDHPDGQAMATRLLTRVFPDNPGIYTLPRRGFTNQISLILEPVAQGLGFTVIPRNARLAFSRQDAVEVVQSEFQVVDTLWLIQRAEWPLSACAMWVLEQLRQVPAFSRQ